MTTANWEIVNRVCSVSASLDRIFNTYIIYMHDEFINVNEVSMNYKQKKNVGTYREGNGSIFFSDNLEGIESFAN